MIVTSIFSFFDVFFVQKTGFLKSVKFFWYPIPLYEYDKSKTIAIVYGVTFVSPITLKCFDKNPLFKIIFSNRMIYLIGSYWSSSNNPEFIMLSLSKIWERRIVQFIKIKFEFSIIFMKSTFLNIFQIFGTTFLWSETPSLLLLQ